MDKKDIEEMLKKMVVQVPVLKQLPNGYTCFTTFWSDFYIAELFGTEAIIDTWERCMDSWKTDYKYLTELVIVLNYKIWYFYEGEKKNDTYAKLYNELWSFTDNYACENLKGDELKYFYETTD